MEKYQNAQLTPEERAHDLLGKMTLEEKIAQLSCKMILGIMPGTEDGVSFTNGVGELAFVGSRPTPSEQADFMRKLQERVIESNRFHIPAIAHVEALSGPTINGAVAYPTGVSLGATFDADLIRDMGEKIREQMVAVGFRQALSPMIDLPRDLRWGRINESYGNDPTLISKLACAYVEGIQGSERDDRVAATAKHFLGYSVGEGGLNMAKVLADERDLRESYAKPFEAVINKSGIFSVMNGYSEIKGRPVAASHSILTELLRDELHFDGLVVSDYNSIDRLINNFKVADSPEDAAAQTLKAGLDVELPGDTFYSQPLLKAVKSGRVSVQDVDRSCLRMLTLKFRLGLFENPYPKSDEEIRAVFDGADVSEGSLRAAREAVVLTKNDGILPLTDTRKRIAIIGPGGNSLRRMFSTYTSVGMEELLLGVGSAMAGVGENQNVEDASEDQNSMNADIPEVMEPFIRQHYPNAKTIFQAITERFPRAEYLEGCDYKNPQRKNISAAVELARDSDIVILTLCGKNGYGVSCTSGEGVDSANVGLSGAQEELLEAVSKANPNLIIVNTDSRPLISAFAYQHARAILEGWILCANAGQVIAETLCGENNPSGRLQRDVPYRSGIDTYHYQNNASYYKTMQFLGSPLYSDAEGVVMRPFGYGESYTSYEYSDASMNYREDDDTVEIQVTVTNSGDRAGTDVVQLYGKDPVASMVRPYHELLGFQRVTLEPGASRVVVFRFHPNIMSFMNENGTWISEKGLYQYYIAHDSSDESLELQHEQTETVAVDPTKRDFFADSFVM